MKLYVHLIYLLGLLCFWEMVIRPEGIRHEELSLDYDALNSHNLSLVLDYSVKLNETIQKQTDDYPSIWAQDYAGRSANALSCFESAIQSLPNISKKDFWQCRTNFYETIKEISDNQPFVIPDDLLFCNKKDIEIAGYMLDHDSEVIEKDIPIRMALVVIRAQNYCATRTNFCGEFKLDNFSPFLQPTYVYGRTNQKIGFGVFAVGYEPSKWYITSPFLRPFKDGISALDTVIQKPGITEIPVNYRFYKTKNNHYEYGVDTVRFEVFQQ